MKNSNSNQVQQEHPKAQSPSQQPTTFSRCMTSLASRLPLPVVNLKDDLKPLMFEVKTARKTQQEIPILGKKETMTTKVSRKMHVLQAKMAIQEMVLTRRARKSNQILEKYKTNQKKLTLEFAALNPQAKAILSEEAKTTLSQELKELDEQQTSRTTRRKRAKMLKKAASDLENQTQK